MNEQETVPCTHLSASALCPLSLLCTDISVTNNLSSAPLDFESAQIVVVLKLEVEAVIISA